MNHATPPRPAVLEASRVLDLLDALVVDLESGPCVLPETTEALLDTYIEAMRRSWRWLEPATEAEEADCARWRRAVHAVHSGTLALLYPKLPETMDEGQGGGHREHLGP